ncbi:MAG: hypothetical protein Q9167_003026 [Letrouitia subvulpina]
MKNPTPPSRESQLKETLKDPLPKRVLLEMLKAEPTIVHVVVGSPESQFWYLPKKLLSYFSDFFKSALDGHFQEATSNSIHLKEDDPEIFAMFVSFISFGHFIEFDFTESKTVKASDWIKLAKAWVLGDKLQSLSFRNLAIGLSLFHYDKRLLHPRFIRVAYKHSPPESKLRKFAMDHITWRRHHLGDQETYSKLFKIWAELAEEFEDVGRDFMKQEFEHQHFRPLEYFEQYLSA